MTATVGSDVGPAPSSQIDPARDRLGFFVWLLLFFNVLAFAPGVPLLVPIPSAIGKLATQGALALATVLVLVFNRKCLVRPNLFLTLFTALAASSLMMSVRMATGVGMLVRAGRFCVFLGVLWLLTPVWGRRDRLLLYWHTTALTIVLSTVVVGGLLAPGRARQFEGRLSGQLWPIPPTQVAHYAAVLAGITFVLLISGSMRARRAWLVGGISVVVLLLTHTRTALVALVAGLACAVLTLITARRRARRAALAAVIVALLGATLFAPQISRWFSRGQTAQQISQLTGRTEVWNRVLNEPRSLLTESFGMGLTNKSFAGLPIDNSWIATYQDAGLFGVAICGAILLSLLMLATTRPRGPCVAVAVFLIVYCAIASTAETGLGDASPYVLDLTVAAALLAWPGDSVVTGLPGRGG